MKMEKFKCEKCNAVFIADSRRWHMDMCPNGCKNGVDLEEWYCRLIGDIEHISSFNAPLFDNEEEYWSALLSWLNDSDEEFELEIDKKTKSILIIKM